MQRRTILGYRRASWNSRQTYCVYHVSKKRCLVYRWDNCACVLIIRTSLIIIILLLFICTKYNHNLGQSAHEANPTKSFLAIPLSEMAESNGELLAGDLPAPATKTEDRGDGERTEDYSKLLEYGLDKKVSE